ncbi:hypothetical protein FKM82_019117 [Ascaphus truei]
MNCLRASVPETGNSDFKHSADLLFGNILSRNYNIQSSKICKGNIQHMPSYQISGDIMTLALTSDTFEPLLEISIATNRMEVVFLVAITFPRRVEDLQTLSSMYSMRTVQEVMAKGQM